MLADVPTRDLLDLIRREIGADSIEYASSPRSVGSAKFSSVHTFELDGAPPEWSGPLVLRFVGASTDQARLEGGLHAAACERPGLRAPRVLLCHPADEQFAAAFLIMRRLAGRPRLRGVDPLTFAADFPSILWSWPRCFATVLEALARLDPSAAVEGLAREGVPDQLRHTDRHLDTAATTLGNEPEFEDVLDWFHVNAPEPPERLSVVHGDLWPGNVFISNGEVGLIDWTRGAIGDPALDVGFAVVGFALMPEPFPPAAPLRQMVHAGGSSVARRMRAYASPMVGGSERVRYFEALRCAVELADVVAHRSRATRSGWEHGVPALVGHLEAITGRRLSFV